MKLLVFAHVPPPHHGQSYMVHLMLDGLGGDARQRPTGGSVAPPNPHGIECYHVDARFSDGLNEVGRFRFKKIALAVGYALQAIGCRFRYGVRNFYYVPAPGARAPLYRDWIVLALCRPFFRTIIFHWQAAGLGRWLLESATPIERWITRRLFGKHRLSILPNRENEGDVRLLGNPEIIVVAPNGIPDPCAQNKSAILMRRRSRDLARKAFQSGKEPDAETLATSGGDPAVVRLLFIALCTRSKGLFDAVEAVALLNKMARAEDSRLRYALTVAGGFASQEEKREFEDRISQPDLRLEAHSANASTNQRAVTYAGFATGEAKQRLFLEADMMCFPTFYEAESFGVVLIEAMAFDLPIVSTRWRGIPNLFPENYPGLVEPHSPEAIAHAVKGIIQNGTGCDLRQRFLDHYTVEHYVNKLAEAMKRT